MKHFAVIFFIFTLLLPVAATQTDDGEALLHQGFYIDVPTDAWYAEAVSWSKTSGILKSTSKATFSPDQPITRIEFLNALYRLHASPVVADRGGFIDVTYTGPEQSAIAWGLQAGITTGMTALHFAPNQPITRQDGVLMLYRCAGLPHASSENSSDTFLDMDKASLWASEAMGWAVNNQLLSGFNDNTLAPSEPLTRAQSAVLLWRYYEQIIVKIP